MRFDTRTQTNAAAPPGKRRKSSVPKSPPSDWGLTRKKVPGSRSKNVFNVAGFQGHESPPPPTPMQNTVHQLTDAKVLAQPTPDGYQPPVLPGTLLLPWAMGASAAGKKRSAVTTMKAMLASSDKDKAEEEGGEDDNDDGPW